MSKSRETPAGGPRPAGLEASRNLDHMSTWDSTSTQFLHQVDEWKLPKSDALWGSMGLNTPDLAQYRRRDAHRAPLVVVHVDSGEPASRILHRPLYDCTTATHSQNALLQHEAGISRASSSGPLSPLPSTTGRGPPFGGNPLPRSVAGDAVLKFLGNPSGSYKDNTDEREEIARVDLRALEIILLICEQARPEFSGFTRKEAEQFRLQLMAERSKAPKKLDTGPWKNRFGCEMSM
ncbi:hypothetical protein BOTBODRAFT_640718 [Botryobasidium botryosum FD-172 SS1]|uniref:Uncharacterized protein n=1 Tax=Botryobasidium botryosum (strain FD-172 SS1) TaxID=930990 RepID=A0A067M2P0_BOTB1|nr:hypothetical protein BOTBODRAFT_640718 [Botryobasidium botryosum FD-172 SS1]